MAQDTLTNLIVVLITSLISGLGVYLTMKYGRRGRLDFVIRRYLPLVEEITRDMPELVVSYMGTPVTQRLVLVEGFLRNSGHTDVSREDVKAPISLLVPAGHIVRDPGTLQTTDEGVEFDIDFIAAGEVTYFRFLIESGDQDADHEANRRSSSEKESDAARQFMRSSVLLGGVKNTTLRTRVLIGSSKGDLSRSWFYATTLLSLCLLVGLFIVSSTVVYQASFTDLILQSPDGDFVNVDLLAFEGSAILALDSPYFSWLNWFGTLDKGALEPGGGIGLLYPGDPLEAASGFSVVSFSNDRSAIVLAIGLMWAEVGAIAFFLWLILGPLEIADYFVDRVREWRALRRARERKL